MNDVVGVPERLGDASALGRLIARFVRDLADSPGVSPNPHLADALVSLVLAETTESVRTAEPEDFADRVLAYCLAHLSDPGLSVESVARAHGVSSRYLYKILEPKKITLWAWIRRRRLERIRDDLLDPAFANRTVSAIAARWGVSDATHLSRALKAEFGQTAAQLRRRVVSV